MNIPWYFQVFYGYKNPNNVFLSYKVWLIIFSSKHPFYSFSQKSAFSKETFQLT